MPHFLRSELSRLALGTLLLAAAAFAQSADCASCHEEVVKKMPPAAAHAKVACGTCHVKHDEYPHPAGVAKPVCSSCHSNESLQLAQSIHGEAARSGEAAPDCSVCHGAPHDLKQTGTAEFRKDILETCAACHDPVNAEFQQSVHGKALAEGSARAPVCSDCHGEHAIRRPRDSASSVNPVHIPETCGKCHGRLTLSAKFRMPLDRVQSFEESFHGLALKSGSLAVANCASCHGIHNILPSSDPKSTINAAHLPQTCGKCHPGAGQRFALGAIHTSETRAAAPAVTWIRRVYLVLIPLVVGLMFLHNAGDWVRKLWALRLSPRPGSVVRGDAVAVPPEVRMYGPERVQHGLLVVSFTVLTWTGFALVYPDPWWAGPLLAFEHRWPVRGTVHRVASVVFMITGVIHLLTLIRSRRLRHHWTELFPSVSDVREAWQGFAYNLGLRKQKPAISAHSYVEKAEYWAVVWGAVVMAVTGVLLWANRWVMAYLPKPVLDIAAALHFYEAVLAALAILVWHIYFVIVDPEVYPMDSAWLTGVSARKRTPHRETPQESR